MSGWGSRDVLIMSSGLRINTRAVSLFFFKNKLGKSPDL